MFDKKMHKLIRTAAASAYAHRNALRLLLQGIHDASEIDANAVQAFFADAENHAAISEVIAFSLASEDFRRAVQEISCQAVFRKVRRAGSDCTLRKYQDIIEAAKDQVVATCPCRECSVVRAKALKSVNACLRRIQDKATRREK
jgi:chromosome condensin MukBEF complex kleisin-like MukF subunit